MTRQTRDAKVGLPCRNLFLAACVSAVLVGIASCGGDGTTPPALPPTPPPPPPPQTAPLPVGSIAPQNLDAGQSLTVDVSSNFRDPDGDALTYAAKSSDEGVATAAASGSRVQITGIGPGTATVTVTAADPGGRMATQGFGVSVRGSVGDDFNSAASRNNWSELNDADISVGGGLLSVTNTRDDRLGIAERVSTPTVNAWTVQARMGRRTRKASPGVASLTGHRRFTAARLVLRTLDDASPDRSADSPATSGNFEFALFDRDTREWVRIANMSGRSGAVREAPDEFTEIGFGHEGADFVAYAGSGSAEELFRFAKDDSSVDGVALGDILEHLTGVWLVNQAEAGLTAVHDWVEVTGTGSSAPVPDGAEVAEALAATARSVSVAGPDADRAALVAFYDAAGGPNWTDDDGWRTNAPLSDWHGITTDGRGRVTRIDLIRNNLAGAISPELGHLSSLTDLLLAHNPLTGEIPSELGSLGNLKGLGLRDAGLTGAIPSELGSLSSLTSLDLAHNHFTGEIPSELGALGSLQLLALNGNELSGEMPAELADLASLTWLSVQSNQLTGEIPPGLGGLSGLTSLTLGGNALTGEIPSVLGDLADLAYLNIQSNELTGGLPSELGGLASLRELLVDHNELAGQLPGSFLDLSLETFWWNENGPLCAPDTSAFQAWLAGIGDHKPGASCVEGPETVGAIPAQVLSIGEAAAVDVVSYFRDSDGDPLTYSAASSNAGIATASLDGTALTVTGVSAGSATVTVTAADPAGLTAAQTVAVTVEAGNRAPEAVGTMPSISVATGGSESVNVSSYFSDPDGDALTYSASSRLPGLVGASMSGSVLTVTGEQLGRSTVTVTAADPHGLTATQRVAVTVGPPNEAPEAVGTIPSLGLPVGGSEPVEVSSYFHDPDGDALTYSAESSDGGVARASMSGSVLTITGVASGRATVTVTAADPGGLTAGQAVAVTVGTGNRAPEAVGTIPAQTLEPGEEASLNISSYFHDPDGDALTYSASSSDDGVVEATMFVNDNRLLVFNVPAAIGEGEATVTVTATDPGGLTATQTVTVTVQANRAPEVVGNRNEWGFLSVNSAYSLSGLSSSFHDPDGDSLTYSATSTNEAMVTVSMNGDTMLITTHNQRGTATIAVTATDPGGLSATQSAPVHVN